jgi:hypothetical protein
MLTNAGKLYFANYLTRTNTFDPPGVWSLYAPGTFGPRTGYADLPIDTTIIAGFRDSTYPPAGILQPGFGFVNLGPVRFVPTAGPGVNTIYGFALFQPGDDHLIIGGDNFPVPIDVDYGDLVDVGFGLFIGNLFGP